MSRSTTEELGKYKHGFLKMCGCDVGTQRTGTTLVRSDEQRRSHQQIMSSQSSISEVVSLVSSVSSRQTCVDTIHEHVQFFFRCSKLVMHHFAKSKLRIRSWFCSFVGVLEQCWCDIVIVSTLCCTPAQRHRRFHHSSDPCLGCTAQHRQDQSCSTRKVRALNTAPCLKGRLMCTM